MENNKELCSVLSVDTKEIKVLKIKITYANSHYYTHEEPLEIILNPGDIYSVTFIENAVVKTITGKVTEIFDKYMTIDYSEKFESKYQTVYYKDIRHIGYPINPLSK